MICADYIEFHFENVYTECMRKKERGKYTVYLKRKVDTFLHEWKADPARKPLIIKGSRQVGKTESIRKFAAEDYESVVEINFVRDEKYKGIIADGYEAAAIIKNISMIDPSKKFIPHKTLLFFDEITEFPEIATSLKFFHEDGRFDVICSGSMLGVNYKKIESNSVGYKKDYDMFSMDFEEFLWAKGYDDTTVEDMLLHMRELRPFNELEMQVYHSLFLDFCILGGMPAVVAEYIEKNTFEGSLDTQRQLIADYKEDIRKYAQGLDQTRILNVFNRIAPQLARENKKFQYSVVKKGSTSAKYAGSLQWIEDAGIITRCHNLSITELPLDGNAEEDTFKVYMCDTGLFVSMLEDGTQFDILQGDLYGYKGAIFENLIADIFTKMGRKLYYFHKDSGLEVDFVIRYQRECTLVEVKARSGNVKSTKTILNHPEKYHVSHAIKLGDYNIGKNGPLLTLPLYMAFLLRSC